MSSFTRKLDVSPLLNGRDWILNKTFIYHIWSRYSKEIIKVPAGFITDFASVPRLTNPLLTLLAIIFILLDWAWLGISLLVLISIASWFSPYGKHEKPAVIHDWLYHEKKIMGEPITRKRADDVFKEAMEVRNVESWRIFVEYWAVRLFGFVSWKIKKENCSESNL